MFTQMALIKACKVRNYECMGFGRLFYDATMSKETEICDWLYKNRDITDYPDQWHNIQSKAVVSS